MNKTLLKDDEFAEMLCDHAADTIDFLLEKEQPFGILCDLNAVEFDPPLSNDLVATFKPLTLFLLSGYTLESADIEEEDLSLVFEAGFGTENIASVVSVPIDAVVQIVLDESVIFVNLCAVPQLRKPRMPARMPTGGASSVEKSMQSLLNNPENRHFVKK